MRIVLASVAVLTLVPATALADEPTRDQQIAPDVVLTIESPLQPKVEQPKVEQPKVEPKKPPGGYVVPESAPYAGGKIPAGATIETRTNMTLVGVGLGIAGVSYLTSVITAAAACPPSASCSSTYSAAWLYLPLVGPFITAATAPSVGGAALAAFDGTLQAIGLGIAFAGVLAPKKFVVWQDKGTTLAIKPSSAGMAGVSLTLTHM